MDIATLAATAKALVAPGKGILAADESSGTIKKRFDSISVESTDTSRRDYREMLFTANNVGDYISGVILYDETIRQDAADGTSLVKLLEQQGIIPGIKVDLGAKPLAGADGETVTEGLDGLRERLAEYRQLGARFAKWRATYTITTGSSEGPLLPSAYCIDVNAHALARYAALCQEAGIVPIVEPEVLMDGDHTIDRSYEVTSAVLDALYEALFLQRVRLDGTLLKPNMVLSGYSCPQQASVEEVAEAIGPLLPVDRARGGPGDRVPLGRPERRGRHRPPQRHEPAGRPALAAQLLLRACAAGAGPPGVEGRDRQRRRRAQRLPPPGQAQQRRPFRRLHAGHGESRRLSRAAPWSPAVERPLTILPGGSSESFSRAGVG